MLVRADGKKYGRQNNPRKISNEVCRSLKAETEVLNYLPPHNYALLCEGQSHPVQVIMPTFVVEKVLGIQILRQSVVLKRKYMLACLGVLRVSVHAYTTD